MTSRVRRTFWTLVVLAVLAAGAFSQALVASPGPATGLTVAVTGLVLVASSLLALRILIVIERTASVDAAPSPTSRPQSERERERRPG